MKGSVRLTQPLKGLFYTTFSILFLSGILWWGLHDLFPNFFKGLSETFSSPLMQIHGAAAMASLFFLGWLVPAHMRRGWQKKRNRKPGLVIITSCALLVVTGYGLYYFGSEWSRTLSVWLHIGTGLLFPFILIWHIWIGKRESRRKAPKRLPPQ